MDVDEDKEGRSPEPAAVREGLWSLVRNLKRGCSVSGVDGVNSVMRGEAKQPGGPCESQIRSEIKRRLERIRFNVDDER